MECFFKRPKECSRFDYSIGRRGILTHNQSVNRVKILKAECFCVRSAAVEVPQREGGRLRFRAAQLELSCSHQSECQDGAEQQEGPCVCVCV